KEDSHSTLSLYKRLIAIRQKEDSLMFGDYIPIYSDSQIIVYETAAPGSSRFMVTLNLSHRTCHVICKSPHSAIIEVATSPELEGNGISENISLSGDEAVVIRLDN